MLKIFNFLKKFKKNSADFIKLKKTINGMSKTCSIGIFGHEGLDRDAIYSCLALARVLEQQGFSRVKVYFEDESKQLWARASILTSIENVTNSLETRVDAAFIVDLNMASRLGKFERLAMAAKTIIVLDHHENPLIKHTLMICDSRRSAAGEIVFELAKAMRTKLTAEIASLLYISIMSDSLSLTVAKNSKSFEIVKELRETNFDVIQANECLKTSLTREEMLAVNKAIATSKTNGSVTTYVFDERKNEFKIDYTKIKDKSLFILGATADIKILLILVVFKDKVKGSLRSYCDRDVNEVASKLGGGGHKKAAGFTTTLPDNYVSSIIYEYFKK